MTASFSSESGGPKDKAHVSPVMKEMSTQNSILVKTFFREKDEIETFSNEGKWTICC